MTQPSGKGRRTRVSQLIKAPRAVVYQAFLDAGALASWLAPDTMRGQVHAFEPYEGGKFRMSLTYLDRQASPGGRTSDDTDTFEGTFVELRPDEKIVWSVEFESEQPEFAGEMRMTWSLADADAGTKSRCSVRTSRQEYAWKTTNSARGSRYESWPHSSSAAREFANRHD